MYVAGFLLGCGVRSIQWSRAIACDPKLDRTGAVPQREAAAGESQSVYITQGYIRYKHRPEPATHSEQQKEIRHTDQ